MTSSAKDLQFRELKDTISELNKTNRALLETITVLNKRIAEMAQEHDNQKEQIDFLTKKLFGRSSEKDINIPGQLNLFNEAEVCQDLALLAKDELEAAVKALNDAIMPIGAKMYEQAAAEESKEGEAAAEGDDKKSDEPVEGEVVDDAKDSKK